MTFQLPNNCYLRLQDKIYYLEIQVRHYQHCKGESMLKELETICIYLHKVCKTMKFDYQISLSTRKLGRRKPHGNFTGAFIMQLKILHKMSKSSCHVAFRR